MSTYIYTHIYIHTYALAQRYTPPTIYATSSDGAVVMSSANGPVGTGFASRYRLQPRAGF